VKMLIIKSLRQCCLPEKSLGRTLENGLENVVFNFRGFKPFFALWGGLGCTSQHHDARVYFFWSPDSDTRVRPTPQPPFHVTYKFR